MANGVNIEDKTVAPVSVIIPCYNCADTIERAVDSVIAQTVLPAEIWIIDDGSTDHTPSVLEEIKSRYSSYLKLNIIRFLTNQGPSAARNAGWDSATQPYIAFLDADDSWHPKKIEVQYNWMEANPDVYLTGNRSIWIQKGINKECLHKNIPDTICAKWITPFLLCLSNIFSTPTVMLKRDLPFRFPADKRNYEDYYLWLKIVLSGYKAYKIYYPLSYIYKAPYGEEGLSKSLWPAEREEIEMFIRLGREGLLPLWKAYLFAIFSFSKFIRRPIIVWIRNFKMRIEYGINSR